jgi:hypothetical protein
MFTDLLYGELVGRVAAGQDLAEAASAMKIPVSSAYYNIDKGPPSERRRLHRSIGRQSRRRWP